MTDRDDFSLPSTVGTSFAGSGASGPVIKVLVGGQVRRVPAHRLVREGSKNQKPSYGILRTLIAKYAFPDRKAPGRDCEVTTTYVDDDGDAITISTDEELEDALSAVIAEAGEGKKQVLRIDAAVKERAAGAQKEGAKGVDEKPKAIEAAKDQKKKKQQQIPERKLAGGKVGKLQWDLIAVGEGKLDAESKDAADRLVRDIVGSIALEKGEAASAEDEAGEEDGEDKKKDEADAPTATDDFIPKAEPLVFVHARHTCDGCGISPIMGVRYHATDRADYDLCQGCFADPSIGGLDRKNFVTEELDRDRVMQQRWGRRFARGRLRCGRSRRCQNGSFRQHHRLVRRHCPVPPAQQKFADKKKSVEQKQDDSDKELQEAVLRSMQEKQAPVESEEGKGNEKVEEKKEAEEETDSKATAPAGEDTTANWRSVADSFSSAAAGSGDFADVLDAVASVVATEIEKQTDIAVDATRSAGDAAADSACSAADASIPNGIAAAITAAMNASRVASTVASEVKAVIDKEIQKKQTVEGSPTGDSIPNDEKGEDVRDIEGNETKPAEVAEGALVEPEDDEAKGDNESEKSDAQVVSEGGEAKKDSKDEDEANEDESEKSEWEDVGAVEDKVGVASDNGSASSAPIAPPVLARWAEQLKVLHQLGFTDDLKCVDALETLQAANVGVDSTDEVTVGDAVNYLLKNAGD